MKTVQILFVNGVGEGAKAKIEITVPLADTFPYQNLSPILT
jgi:hypothetical protein